MDKQDRRERITDLSGTGDGVFNSRLAARICLSSRVLPPSLPRLSRVINRVAVGFFDGARARAMGGFNEKKIG